MQNIFMSFLKGIQYVTANHRGKLRLSMDIP